MKTLTILYLCFVALVAVALPPYVPTIAPPSVALAWGASPSKASAGVVNYELLSGPDTNSLTNFLLMSTNLYCPSYPLQRGVTNWITVVTVDTNAGTVSGYAPFVTVVTSAIPFPSPGVTNNGPVNP